MTEKENKERKLLVVNELPQRQIRSFVGEDEIEYDIMTIEEALSEILPIVRELRKSLVGN